MKGSRSATASLGLVLPIIIGSSRPLILSLLPLSVVKSSVTALVLAGIPAPVVLALLLGRILSGIPLAVVEASVAAFIFALFPLTVIAAGIAALVLETQSVRDAITTDFRTCLAGIPASVILALLLGRVLSGVPFAVVVSCRAALVLDVS